MPNADQLVRIQTAANLVSKDQAAMRRAIDAGKLPVHRTADGLRLVLPADAERWATNAQPGRPKKT